MEINISNCGECPFCVTDTDTDSTGHDTIVTCQLALFKHNTEYIITIYDSWDDDRSDDCEYCKEWQEDSNRLWDDEEIVLPWYEHKCTCDEIKREWFEEHKDESPLHELPNWCPLTEPLTITKHENTKKND